MLSDELESKICVYLQKIVKIENSVMNYQLSSYFNQRHFSRLSKSYIERRFLMVAETRGYLEQDFKFVSRILFSNELNISSELEVFKAADNWLSYDIVGRSQHAKDILLKVRLHLLSDPALDHVLRKHSSFGNNEECRVLMEKILKEKTVYRNSINFRYNARYCSQTMFNVIAVDTKDTRSLQLVNYNIGLHKLSYVKDFPQLAKYHEAIF